MLQLFIAVINEVSSRLIDWADGRTLQWQKSKSANNRSKLSFAAQNRFMPMSAGSIDSILID